MPGLGREKHNSRNDIEKNTVNFNRGKYFKSEEIQKMDWQGINVSNDTIKIAIKAKKYTSNTKYWNNTSR